MESDQDPFTDGFEEDRDQAGNARAGYTELLQALGTVDLAELSTEVTLRLERHGVTFGGEPFVIDPVPRLISSAEWETLAEGLAHPTRAATLSLPAAGGGRGVAPGGFSRAQTTGGAGGLDLTLFGR